MNAETRAKEIANRLDGANPREWNRIIAQALRQAENDKLEAAARIYDAKVEDGCMYMAATIAADLRSLKSKDTP